MSQIYVDKMAESVRGQIPKIQTAAVIKEAIRLIQVKSQVVAVIPPTAAIIGNIKTLMGVDRQR